MYSNNTILLAPYILDNIKPLELPYFIDSFTSYTDNNSKGCLYLLYYYKSITNYNVVNAVVKKQKNFFNIKIIKYKNNLFILVTFKLLDNFKDFENIKKFGNLGYSKFDYISLLDFWHSKYTHIKQVLLETFKDIQKSLDEKRLDSYIQPLLF